MANFFVNFIKKHSPSRQVGTAHLLFDLFPRISSIHKIFKTIFAFVFEIFFPKTCVFCGKEGFIFCEDHLLPSAPLNQVSFGYIDQIFARTAYYAPEGRSIVEAFKFGGNTALSEVMAQEILKSIPEDFLPQHSILVPMPLHFWRWLFRGYNQSLVLAKSLQKIRPDLQINQSLFRKRSTAQQAKLSREERLKNLQEAFQWKGDRFECLILIDDVVASGATLESAARCLKNSGIKEVRALVFARGGGL